MSLGAAEVAEVAEKFRVGDVAALVQSPVQRSSNHNSQATVLASEQQQHPFPLSPPQIGAPAPQTRTSAAIAASLFGWAQQTQGAAKKYVEENLGPTRNIRSNWRSLATFDLDEFGDKLRTRDLFREIGKVRPLETSFGDSIFLALEKLARISAGFPQRGRGIEWYFLQR
jgi:hypothetical protein